MLVAVADKWMAMQIQVRVWRVREAASSRVRSGSGVGGLGVGSASLPLRRERGGFCSGVDRRQRRARTRVARVWLRAEGVATESGSRQQNQKAEINDRKPRDGG